MSTLTAMAVKNMYCIVPSEDNWLKVHSNKSSYGEETAAQL